MGFTYVEVTLYNPAHPEIGERVSLLVDSGAYFTSIPSPVLEKLGLKPQERRKLRVYGGQIIERDIGIAGVEYEGHHAGITVLFGQPEDTPVLGITALESLGYQLDPVTKKLKPVELLMVCYPLI